MNMKEKSYEMCRALAAEYDGWEFQGGGFVCKRHKPFVLGLDVFAKVAMSHVSLQAIEWVKVGPIVRSIKVLFPKYKIPCHFTRQPKNEDGSIFVGVYSDISQLEPVIEKFVRSAIPNASTRYCLDGIEEFAEQFPQDNPFNFIGMQGVHYCLLRMLVGDFDYIKKCYEEALAGNNDYRFDELGQIMPLLEEMESNLKRTGRLMK
ncbi:hypothetical protein [Simiduia agarivorans]|uniref:Uncharacterized protein n=1 Tax=Simiduia agarivorans (strain DSM 21679 / JCM 13881 / BCRC 17597 / SA1) TaxID=1117647 RepID=K4KEX5_SIMAS|nr:hypothetical protein [Simiduia agarivorans]AFU97496.1 hypothetical protein M5M_01345 [Simiduia agarivorans SA1 = DSM 21679]